MPDYPPLDPDATVALLQAAYLHIGLSLSDAWEAACADYARSYAPAERMAA